MSPCHAYHKVGSIKNVFIYLLISIQAVSFATCKLCVSQEHPTRHLQSVSPRDIMTMVGDTWTEPDKLNNSVTLFAVKSIQL